MDETRRGAHAPYRESEHHVPDPTAMSGQLDTSGTSSGGDSRLENLSPIFEVARAQDLAWAMRALDPDDDEVHSDQVQVSQGITVTHGSPDEDRDRVRHAAQAARQKLEGTGFNINDSGELDPKPDTVTAANAIAQPADTSASGGAQLPEDELDDPAGEADREPEGGEGRRMPAKSGSGSSHAAWITYALAKDSGLTREQAEAMSRNDLIAKYGT